MEQLRVTPELLTPERRRDLLAAAAARSQLSPRGAVDRIRSAAGPIAQTAVAAGIAWFVAKHVLGHSGPFFAPVAAIIALGATRGQRARQAIEMMLGVALGVGLADLLIHLTGSGVTQLVLVIGLAMTAAVALDAGRILVTEAASAAALVATVGPTGEGIPSGRLVDALTGGIIALCFSQLLFPVHPLRVVRDAAESVLRELGETLVDVADALAERDQEAAEASLLRARRISDDWSRFEQALDVSREVTELAPRRRRFRERLDTYREAKLPLDLIVRDIHVLARGAVRALMIGDEVPEGLVDALRDLAKAIDGVAAGLRGPGSNDEVQEVALRAARLATRMMPRDEDVSVGVLVGYTQATAADVIRALGADREPAHELVGRAVSDGD